MIESAAVDRILIIDDEPFELSLFRDMLDDGRYRFETATSGRQARRIIDERGEDLRAVLLDWNLADEDGLELLRWIKEHPKLADVETVVQSADFVPDFVQCGIDCGAFYYLTKPFEKAQLQAIVRAAIASFDLKRTLAAKIEETEDTIRMMTSGSFRVRTREEARLLAIHLGSACSDPQRGVGLLELLLNAVEHGNLEIGYDDKGQLLSEGDLEREVDKRLRAPEYRDRWVTVDVDRRPDHFDVVITDQGPGFDFERYLTLDENRLFDSHGRGVLLANTALDLEYLPPGNRVRVAVPVRDESGG